MNQEWKTLVERYCWKPGNLPDGYDHKYLFTSWIQSKITDMQGLWISSINKLEKFISVRNKNYELYRNLFKDLEKFFFFKKAQVARLHPGLICSYNKRSKNKKIRFNSILK